MCYDGCAGNEWTTEFAQLHKYTRRSLTNDRASAYASLPELSKHYKATKEPISGVRAHMHTCTHVCIDFRLLPPPSASAIYIIILEIHAPFRCNRNGCVRARRVGIMMMTMTVMLMMISIMTTAVRNSLIHGFMREEPTFRSASVGPAHCTLTHSPHPTNDTHSYLFILLCVFFSSRHSDMRSTESKRKREEKSTQRKEEGYRIQAISNHSRGGAVVAIRRVALEWKEQSGIDDDRPTGG